MFHGGGAPGGDHAPFRLGQFTQPLPDPVCQFIILGEITGCGFHRLDHLRPFDRSAENCKCTAAIDDGVNPNRLVNVLFLRGGYHWGLAGEKIGCHGGADERDHR